MTIQEFRAYAHELVDWMADYLLEVERFPVRFLSIPLRTESRSRRYSPTSGTRSSRG